MPKAKRTRDPAAPVEAALAALAHDIRTPLTGIIAFSELLAASELPERERRWAAAVKGAAEHLAQLTTLVLDAAKMNAKTLVLRDEVFSPRRLARDVGMSLSSRADAKGLEAKIAIARSVPDVARGDLVRLRAALENLIDNAVKFTERGAVALKVSVEPSARGRLRLAFTVTDSGIGIVPNDLKKLFRPFAQANVDVARRFGGSGLGLVLVKRLAKTMGGDLTVTSKSGRGSIFKLTVTLATPAATDGKRPRAKRKPQGKPLRILCAEDNPYGRVVLNTILTELGHSVDFVGTGEAAVEAVRRGRYDAVLMDVMLPGTGGMAAAKQIRALPARLRSIPIIGLTGRSSGRDEAAARAAGMNHYLRKPVSPKALDEAIAAVTTMKS